MAAARHQQQAEHHRDRARTEQPPANRQYRRHQIARDIIGPRRRLQRAHAGGQQYPAEQQEDHQPRSDAPGLALERDQLPQQQVEEDQAGAEQQRV
ncbi:hypothetical protein D3C76_1451130 [compost metagenome]